MTATVGNVTTRYHYDGEGKRVKKVVGTGAPLRFVYGVGGTLVDEYECVSATPTAPTMEYVYGATGLLTEIEFPCTGKAGYKYLTPDALGTPRIATNHTGAVISRHDYLPFGEEIVPAVGNRTAIAGYGQVDQVRKKFTGYERDEETGLDFAQARYYANTMGRFMSVDPFTGSGRLVNPQTLNRYHYAQNNPLSYVDPDGLAAQPTFGPYSNLSEEERRILEDSTITVGKGKNARTLSGEDLYNHLAKNEKKHLANFLNQTAVLGSVKFENGRTALSYINSVTQFKQDRIFAEVDPELKIQVEAASSKETTNGVQYIGPENAGFHHGKYSYSFRENVISTLPKISKHFNHGKHGKHGKESSTYQTQYLRKFMTRYLEGTQQLSFSPSKKFGAADIDIDYYNKYTASVEHTGEVIKNTLFRTRTNPYKVYGLLLKRPGAAIQPNYEIKK